MKFTVAPHSIIPGAEVVQVLDDAGQLLATIMENRTGTRGLKVISKFATGQVDVDRSSHPQFAVCGRRITAVSVDLSAP